MNTENQINDGGAAFPMAGSTANWDAEKGQYVPQYGMTLRDWLAGQALANLALSYMADYRNQDDAAFALAKECYTVADAMLAARNQTKP